jgi:transposase
LKTKGYIKKDFPCNNTVLNILNRAGYSLSRVLKIKPLKKIPEVDSIFENIKCKNKISDEQETSLRISIDSKAKVKIGDFSRNGKSRMKKVVKGLDHDYNCNVKLIPFGILDVKSKKLSVYYFKNNETSDSIVDAIDLWWTRVKKNNKNIKEIVINLDNGPHCSSRRSQFLKRISEFSTKNNIIIKLVYYPPYHSKYNPIERCWASLEQHWNGELLNSVNKVIKITKTMVWSKFSPYVKYIKKEYHNGVKVLKNNLDIIKNKIFFSNTLPKWDLTFYPKG